MASLVHGFQCIPVAFAKTLVVSKPCNHSLASLPPLVSPLKREPLQQEISPLVCGAYDNGNATLLLDRTRTFLTTPAGIMLSVILFEWRDLSNQDICVGLFIPKTQQVIFSRWSHKLVTTGRGTIQETNSLCSVPKDTVQNVVRTHNECKFSTAAHHYANAAHHYANSAHHYANAAHHYANAAHHYANATGRPLDKQSRAIFKILRGRYSIHSVLQHPDTLVVIERGVVAF